MNTSSPPSTSWRYFDFWLLGAVAILTIFGIAMIRSAIADNIELAELDLVRRQIIFVVIGFVVILVTTAIDYHLWSAISRPMYLGMTFLLAVLFVVGAALFGVGWGLCGVCPGPAIAGLGAGNWDLLWALAGIALGALVQGLRAK